MEFSRITARGQTTIPRRIREAANLRAGDVIAFEVEGEHLVVRKVTWGEVDYLQASSEVMSEWSTLEDDEAWRDL